MIYLLHTYFKNIKKVVIALQEIYGVGGTLSKQICDQLGLNDKVKIHQLTSSQIDVLIRLISKNYLISSPLKRRVRNDIERLIKISSYRGFRHTQKLPVRGQRTSTNAQTCRRMNRTPAA